MTTTAPNTNVTVGNNYNLQVSYGFTSYFVNTPLTATMTMSDNISSILNNIEYYYFPSDNLIIPQIQTGGSNVSTRWLMVIPSGTNLLPPELSPWNNIGSMDYYYYNGNEYVCYLNYSNPVLNVGSSTLFELDVGCTNITNKIDVIVYTSSKSSLNVYDLNAYVVKHGTTPITIDPDDLILLHNTYDVIKNTTVTFSNDISNTYSLFYFQVCPAGNFYNGEYALCIQPSAFIYQTNNININSINSRYSKYFSTPSTLTLTDSGTNVKIKINASSTSMAKKLSFCR